MKYMIHFIDIYQKGMIDIDVMKYKSDNYLNMEHMMFMIDKCLQYKTNI